MAGNVGGGVAVRANEAVVLVGSAPGNAIRLARSDHGGGETLVLGAINLDGDDTAVSVGRSGKGAHKGDGLHEGHVDCWFVWLIEGCLERCELLGRMCVLCRERMDDITRISRMSDCGTVTKDATALQKWKLKLDEKIE